MLKKEASIGILVCSKCSRIPIPTLVLIDDNDNRTQGDLEAIKNDKENIRVCSAATTEIIYYHVTIELAFSAPTRCPCQDSRCHDI